jgi:uncharacterized protein (UPF0297 family)
MVLKDYCDNLSTLTFEKIPGNFFSEIIGLKDIEINKIKSIKLFKKILKDEEKLNNKNEKNKKENSMRENEKNKKENSMRHSNFKEFLNEEKNENILLIMKDQSYSSDIYYKPTKDIIIGFQARSGEQKVHYYNFNEEIEKFGMNENKQNILVYVCSNLNEKLENLINKESGYIIFGEGNYIKKSKKKILSSKKKKKIFQLKLYLIKTKLKKFINLKEILMKRLKDYKKLTKVIFILNIMIINILSKVILIKQLI